MLFNATRFSYQGSPGWSFVSFSCNEGTIIRIRYTYHYSFYAGVFLLVALLQLMMRRTTTMMLLLCCCCWWWCSSSSSWGCFWMLQVVRMVRSLGQQLEDHQLILLSRLGRVPAISRFSEGSWIDFIGNSHPGGWIPCCAARPVVMRIQASGTNAANVVASSIPIQH